PDLRHVHGFDGYRSPRHRLPHGPRGGRPVRAAQSERIRAPAAADHRPRRDVRPLRFVVLAVVAYPIGCCEDLARVHRVTVKVRSWNRRWERGAPPRRPVSGSTITSNGFLRYV